MQHIATLPRRLSDWFGIELTGTSHAERIVATLGGLVGIALVLAVSGVFVTGTDAALVVASMGASAVLVFAVPHGPLSQPWSVLGGHLVSAVIGVSCARLVPEPLLAAPLAVALAIGAMYYLRCIHPPGGATALTAVVAGPAVQSLGYGFVLTPVLVNALTLLAAGVAFNALFHWRRYPAALQRRAAREPGPGAAPAFSHADIEHALRSLDVFVDVTEDELNRLYALASEHAAPPGLAPEAIRPGAYYSNGCYGERWSVREVVDASGRVRLPEGHLLYRVVAGQGRRGSGVCTRAEFARWARHEVYLNESSWQQVPRERAAA